MTNSRATRYAGVFAAATMALVGSACSRTSYTDTKLRPAPPMFSTAVGPIPGPATIEPRPRNPYTNNRDARGDGRQLFVRFNCAGCHGDHAGGGMGPSLRDVDWIYGSDDAQIFSSIAEGRAYGMPSWATKLTADQVWKLVTYIKSLRKRDEVDPPA